MYLKTLYQGTTIVAYLVDNEENNPSEIDGVPVLHIDQKCELNGALPVYLGTRGIFHERITQKLNLLGIQKVIPVTQEMDRELRNAFVPRYFQQNGWRFQKLKNACGIKDSNFTCDKAIEDMGEACIYVVKSLFDKSIREEAPMNEYEVGLQVGAALSNEKRRDCLYFDDMGEHISQRNRQFCELTALYWIWKNAREGVVGIEHYRRHFLLEHDWYAAMINNEVDVVLTVPLYVHPSIAENYRQRHEKKPWEVMREILKGQEEMYREAVDYFENTGCYSPCNMLIAKKEVFDLLCEWLFPILFETTQKIGEFQDFYQNRYPGFLAERLISFFFHYHRKRYKLVYVDKYFLN